MKLEDIKQFIEENKEDESVQEFIKGLNSFSKDDVEAYLTQDEGKQLLQPKLDSYFAKGLESWKQNNLDKLINEKLKEINPEQSPEQIELQQIRQQLAEMENSKQREVLKNKALTVANEKQIPTNLVDYFIGDSEDTTLENLSTFEEAMKTYVDSQVKARISDSSYTPPSSDDTKKAFTKEQVHAMSAEEINENWEDIKDIM